MQNILSSGLEALYRICKADVYEARHELLYNPNGPPRKAHFVYMALKCANAPPEAGENMALAKYGPAKLAAIMARRFYHDKDSGPADLLKWAYSSEPESRFVYQLDRSPLRASGYFILDRQRLEARKIFAAPWKRPDILTFVERHEVSDEWASSWYERATIYRAGGRGYWDFGDKSKVVWPVEKKRRWRPQPKRGGLIPRSDAKRILLQQSARIDMAIQQKRQRTNS